MNEVLKETLEKIKSDLALNFPTTSINHGTLTNIHKLLSLLDSLGDIDELTDNLQGWHDMFAPNCEGCSTCEGSIPRLRNAQDIQVTF